MLLGDFLLVDDGVDDVEVSRQDAALDVDDLDDDFGGGGGGGGGDTSDERPSSIEIMTVSSSSSSLS